MSHGASSVQIDNGYSVTINVAYMRFEPSCGGDEGGDPWEVRGWRVLAPGGSTTIANPTSNQWFYLFAEAVDGHLWTGPFVESVTIPIKFSRCAGLETSTTEPVGFRELDTAAHDHFILVK